MRPKDPPPCTCIKADPILDRPPILDPFCNGNAAHKEAAVLVYEPTYDPKDGYKP